MPDPTHSFTADLFYSYCHKDAQYRDSMEKALALLKSDGLLKDWHDQNILPGQSISQEIKQKMDRASILVFLFSHEFFASEECMREWTYAKEIASPDHPVFRIPVILKPCPWEEVLRDDDVKALPTDAIPIESFSSADAAWTDVYSGIKAVVTHLRETFTPKPDWLRDMEHTEFLSQQRIKLQDIFVFPNLSHYPPQTNGNRVLEDTVTEPDNLLTSQYSLIRGDEASGKTAIIRYLFLQLVDKSQPALFVDLRYVPSANWDNFLRTTYQQQFTGDYNTWQALPEKTILLDNLSPARPCMDFILWLKSSFGRLIVTVASDIYNSFFKDEFRLADFSELRIRPLTQRQQETLIRQRLELAELGEPITDGLIDRVENRINSIIISHKVVPRYPFFVLSILQSYEAFMPSNMSMTSYGYCYHALIVATLIKAGISKDDTHLDTCFNFANHLAFAIHRHTADSPDTPFDIDRFVKEYRTDYIIGNSVLNRLKDNNYGIITSEGLFRAPFIYYFFLGRFFARNAGKEEIRDLIDHMCEASYLRANYLSLLFTLHHTDDKRIIENILLHTICTLEKSPIATLDEAETKRFGSIITSLPENILSNDPVEKERGKIRDTKDEGEQREADEEGQEEGDEEIVNDWYRILKNNEIMGQILRNKHGSLQKKDISEIIETIADGGLRLVNSVLKDDKEIAELARYIKSKYPDYDLAKIKKEIQFFAFVWTMVNIEKIVEAINVPDLREVVKEMVQRRRTPAYDLIGYFSQLDGAPELTANERDELDSLLKKYHQVFLKRVLSIRTQHYMNTHRSKREIEQAVCARLGVRYVSRYRAGIPSKTSKGSGEEKGNKTRKG